MADYLGLPDGVQLKPIPGISEKYKAGSDGHIYCFSSARVNARKPYPFRLFESTGDTGYTFVSLVGESGGRSRNVHTLICAAFHGQKPSPTNEVRHLDGSKTNNLPGNLAWGTPAENEADKRRHGTASIGSKHGAAKLTEEAVAILRVAIPNGLWNAVDAASVFGVDQSVIRAAVAGKTWKHVP